MRLVAALILIAACGGTRTQSPHAPTSAPRVAETAPPHLDARSGGPTWRDAPPAPLDVVAWLDERERIVGFDFKRHVLFVPPTPPPLPRTKTIRTHRLAGPATLDAEIEALDADVRGCYRGAGAGATRMKLTIDARTIPARIVGVEPSDAPFALVGCIADALRDVRTTATEPVVIVAGPAT